MRFLQYSLSIESYFISVLLHDFSFRIFTGLMENEKFETLSDEGQKAIQSVSDSDDPFQAESFDLVTFLPDTSVAYGNFCFCHGIDCYRLIISIIFSPTNSRWLI